MTNLDKLYWAEIFTGAITIVSLSFWIGIGNYAVAFALLLLEDKSK